MKSASGFLKPIIVIQLLVVMVLAGVGTAFAVEPHSVVPTATPGPTVTPVAGGSLVLTNYAWVYNAAMTQVTGVTVTVHNKDADAVHSGTVQAAIDHEGSTITGQGTVTDITAGATTQVTVALGPISVQGTYLEALRIVITQTN